MCTDTTSPPAPAVQGPSAIRRVAWLHQEASQPGRAAQFTCRRVLTAAATPEGAAAEALLAYYGHVRPALAPDRVTVDGTTLLVDEWTESAVFLVHEADPRAAERARLELAVVDLRARALAAARLHALRVDLGALLARRLGGLGLRGRQGLGGLCQAELLAQQQR